MKLILNQFLGITGMANKKLRDFYIAIAYTNRLLLP